MQGPFPAVDHVQKPRKKMHNKDENIVNVCLCLQQAMRSDTLNKKTSTRPYWDVSRVVLRFHTRRLLGDSVGPASDDILLVTLGVRRIKPTR